MKGSKSMHFSSFSSRCLYRDGHVAYSKASDHSSTRCFDAYSQWYLAWYFCPITSSLVLHVPSSFICLYLFLMSILGCFVCINRCWSISALLLIIIFQFEELRLIWKWRSVFILYVSCISCLHLKVCEAWRPMYHLHSTNLFVPIGSFQN